MSRRRPRNPRYNEINQAKKLERYPEPLRTQLGTSTPRGDYAPDQAERERQIHEGRTRMKAEQDTDGRDQKTTPSR